MHAGYKCDLFENVHVYAHIVPYIKIRELNIAFYLYCDELSVMSVQINCFTFTLNSSTYQSGLNFSYRN
jgi:hypothetical protein